MSVGQNKKHESAVYHVTGLATYTDDQLEPVGMLHCYPVLSEHAHAHIQVDFSKALSVAGVVTVLTAADVKGENNTGPIIHDETLFPETVLYAAQPIVWVVAKSLEAAKQAAKLVIVNYDILEPILSKLPLLSRVFMVIRNACIRVTLKKLS